MVIQIVSNSSKSIFLFGTKHSKDLRQLELIQDSIKKFGPDVVLIEGNFDKAAFNSEEEAIKSGKELGFASFYCKSNNIPMFSNDPLKREDRDYITRRYDKEISQLYFFIRSFSANQNIGKNLIPKNVNLLTQKILKEKFNLKKDYSDYFNPTLEINLFNKISKELSSFRDSCMVNKTKLFLTKCDKIFLIKGDYHIKNCLDKIKLLVQNGQ